MILIPKHSMLRPHGTILATDGDGPDFARDTIQCVHCGRHGVFKPGCGAKLGHCLKCMGPTCPNPKCGGECLGPLEARLELFEAGKLAVI